MFDENDGLTKVDCVAHAAQLQQLDDLDEDSSTCT